MVPTSSNNLKTEVDNLDLVKLKAVPKDLKKKISDVADKEIAAKIQNTKQKNR